jgi:hypothetical protein
MLQQPLDRSTTLWILSRPDHIMSVESDIDVSDPEERIGTQNAIPAAQTGSTAQAPIPNSSNRDRSPGIERPPVVFHTRHPSTDAARFPATSASPHCSTHGRCLVNLTSKVRQGTESPNATKRGWRTSWMVSYTESLRQ